MADYTDPWEEVETDERVMTEEEANLAASIYTAIQRSAHDSPRSRQSQAYVIGISDLGTCSEYTRRKLAGMDEVENDKLEAFLGSAIGTAVEEAVAAMDPEVKIQVPLTVKLEGDGGVYEIDGSADFVHPWGIGDGKTTASLSVVRRTGPSQQQSFQRHLYCKGASDAGLLQVPLEEAKVYNVWLDRSGRSKELHVHMEPYSQDVVDEATRWLDEVVYNYRQGIAAMKEPPRTWCEKVCGFFENCRLYDSDVEGLILDPDIRAAVEVHQRASKLAKRARDMKEDANAILSGVNGYVPGFQIRNTWVNPNSYEVDRKGYYRLSISKTKSV